MTADFAQRNYALRSPGTRVLIVAAGTYAPGARLPNVPAAATTARDLEWLLLHRCEVTRENLSVLVDPADPIELGRAVGAAAAAATDALVLYYIGHGLVSPGNELYLATAATDDELDGLAFKALPYQAIRDVLGTCRARSVLVVLDCCFAGRARGSFGNAAATAFDLASFGGTYLLSAASATEQALAPEGARHTAFTGAVIELLYEGDPAGPPDITVESMYRHLRRELPRRDIPPPQRSVSGNAGDIALTPNPATPPRSNPLPPPENTDDSDAPCPYRGLDPFTADDTRYFFGRETALAELLNTASTFADDGPVFLVGVSGVGKSSLLQAGFLPAIARGELRLAGASSWPRLSMTPGRRPLATLAQRLLPNLTAETLPRLYEDPTYIRKICADALYSYRGADVPDGRLLLVVDQFEELFTTCEDEAERRAFITAIDAISHSIALVVIAVRADFYAHCVARPELARALQHRQIAVAPMTADQLRDAIGKPAAVSGLTLEPGLSDRLLSDLGSDPGAAGASLPLLSYALRQTWIRRQDSTLTFAGYEASGGIRNAVTQQADLAFASLDTDARRAARHLLLRMVHLGSDTEDTRRTIDLDELVSEFPQDTTAVQAACTSFSDKRLIVVDGRSARITHDALLHAWPRLRRWIDEDRRGLLVRQQLVEDAAGWRHAGRDRDLLYRGARLAAAREWSREPRNSAQLGQVDKEFLDRSVRSTRRNRVVALASVLVLLFAIAAGGIAIVQYRSASAQAALDDSASAARTADTIRDTDPAAALQLSLAAYRISPTPQARAALLAAAGTPFPIEVGRTDKSVLRLVTSTDGHALATSHQGQEIRLWDVTDDLHPAAGSVIKSDRGNVALAFVPGTHILAAQSAASLRLWDVSDVHHPIQLGQSDFPESATIDVAIDATGTFAASVGVLDGVLRLWDITDRHHPVLDAAVPADASGSHAVVFDPQRRYLATGGARDSSIGGSGAASVKLWDIANPQTPTVVSTTAAESIVGLAFSPSGNLLVAVGSQRAIGIWDTTDPTKPVSKCGAGQNYQLMAGDLYRVEFDTDRAFVTADTSGSVDRWTMDRQSGCADLSSKFPAKQAVTAISLGRDGRRIASGTADGRIQLWSNPTAAPLPDLWTLRDRRGSGLGFSAGSRYFIDDNIWDVSTPTDPQELPPPANAAWLPQERLPGRDNYLLSTNSGHDTASLWDVTNFRHPVLLSTFGRPGDFFLGDWATSADGRLLAVPRLPGPTIDVWNLADPGNPSLATTISGLTRRPTTALTDEKDPMVSVRFIRQRLLTASDARGVRMIDLSNPAEPSPPVEIYHPDDRDLAFHPGSLTISDSYLVTGPSASGPVIVRIDANRNPERVNLNLPSTKQGAVFLASNILTIAVANHIEIWDLQSRSLRSIVSTGREVLANSLAASPNGRLLAVMTEDGAARVWDVSSPGNPVSIGQTVQTKSPGIATSVQFSPDSRLLAFAVAAERTGLATQLVDLDPARVYRHLCSIAPHDLSPDTWSTYLPNVRYRAPCP